MEQLIANAVRSLTGISVMFLDLDRFKSINDTLGHHVGDRLLLDVSGRLMQCLRENDIVARLGGDEFVVVLPGSSDVVTVSHIANKIRDALNAPFEIDGNNIFTSPSIGISLYPKDGTTVDLLMKHADTAMYSAKQDGRNQFRFFSAEMNASLEERLSIEKDLRDAVSLNEFSLHYQPIINAGDGRIDALEALIRWNKPGKGLIPPDKFIPVAEESSLILQIGNWVIQEACRQLATWHRSGLDQIRLSINLSTRQLRQPDLAFVIGEIIRNNDLNPAMLEFEITETAAMENAEQTRYVLWALRGVGVRIAIDDFGTGYTSLNYLKLFPVQRLKIDRTFVKDILTDANDAAIATASISLAHSLGLDVVAEGVENREQLAFLKKHHCDNVQGYLFARPLPAAEIQALLEENDGQFFLPGEGFFDI